MKRVFFIILFIPMFLYSQQAVKTESAGGKYKNYISSTSGDTLITQAPTVTGSSILYTGMSGFVVGVLVGSPVASDTIIIKNGVGVVAQIILPASGLSPYYIPIGARVDTSLIFTQKKTSNTTLIYRTNY
jgi:hypothetical protein